MKKSLLLLSTFAFLLSTFALVPSAHAYRAQPATTATRAVLINNAMLVADGTITATAVAGAATLSKTLGVVTSEALTTAAAAAYTLTITNTTVTAASIVTASVANGTNTQGIPIVGTVTPGAGSVVIKVYNLHASQALNGTLVISFNVVK